jgi:riboflavin synthase
MGEEDLPEATYDGDWAYTFSLPAALSQYVVEKGSITIDGISLTVADVDEDAAGEGTLTVAVIPATYEETTLSAKVVGDPVHYEVDVLAKYVEKQLSGEQAVGAGIAEVSEALRS